MTNQPPADIATEAERYLAAVALFRAEGREPQWQLEPGTQRRRRDPQPLSRVLYDHTPGRDR